MLLLLAIICFVLYGIGILLAAFFFDENGKATDSKPKPRVYKH
jgi:hypothetical protein